MILRLRHRLDFFTCPPGDVCVQGLRRQRHPRHRVRSVGAEPPGPSKRPGSKAFQRRSLSCAVVRGMYVPVLVHAAISTVIRRVRPGAGACLDTSRWTWSCWTWGGGRSGLAGAERRWRTCAGPQASQTPSTRHSSPVSGTSSPSSSVGCWCSSGAAAARRAVVGSCGR